MNRIVLAAVAAVAAIACGAAPRRASLLIDDVRGYNDGIRWHNPAQAAVRIPPAEREPFFEERDEIADDLRISDYEITRVQTASRRLRAIVHVKWTWHLDSEGIVHTTTTQQKWELHGKVWLMLEERWLRGEPMPGIPEPDRSKSRAGLRRRAARDKLATPTGH